MSVFDFIQRADLVPCLKQARQLFASSTQLRKAVHQEVLSVDDVSDIVVQRLEGAQVRSSCLKIQLRV